MTEYNGQERRSNTCIDIETKTMIQEMRDTLIRIEPVIEDVKKIKKWKEGNGVPGAQFQLWILWFVFLAVLGKMWDK